jgi:hypothetical protein
LTIRDTREQNPFDFSRFQGWFSGVERRALRLGGYSIARLEEVCVIERKNLSDLVCSFTTERNVFFRRLRQMADYHHCLPAVLAGLRIPFICTESHEMGEEILASYLYQLHLYHWLEENGFGPTLTDDSL